MSKETAKDPKKKKSFNKKKLKYGSVATIITVIFIAVIVFINLIAGILTERKGLKLDLTPEKYYDISQQTIDYSVQFIFWNCPSKLPYLITNQITTVIHIIKWFLKL
mgnify:CR=1 FL=1